MTTYCGQLKSNACVSRYISALWTRIFVTPASICRHNKKMVIGLGSLLCFFVLITIVWPKLNQHQFSENNPVGPSPEGRLPRPFRESKLAHEMLDGMRGIEIGASTHNPFGLKTLNVDYTDQMDVFREEQMKLFGTVAKVDIVAPGDRLPFSNNSQDFVVSSHVLEHFFDPIKTIEEWLRVIRPGGYIFMIIPHKDRTFDSPRNRTTLSELLQRHNDPPPPTTVAAHHSVWITADVLELCIHFNWTVAAAQNVDDKIGDGFTVVIQK